MTGISWHQACSAKNIIIVNCTQCPRGHVEAAYKAGTVLYDTGIVPGFDLTPCAALMKLSFLLGCVCVHVCVVAQLAVM